MSEGFVDVNPEDYMAMKAECDRLKEELSRHAREKSGDVLIDNEMDCLREQIDRLKAEVEVAWRKNGVSQRAWLSEKVDCDAWKAQAERLTESLKTLEKCEGLVRDIDKNLCMDCGTWKAKYEDLAKLYAELTDKWAEGKLEIIGLRGGIELFKDKAEKRGEALRDIIDFDTCRLFEGGPGYINPEVKEIVGECARKAKAALEEAGK